MSDPLALIAAGAAIGGAAGKFVEKAWDSSERWLRERFGSHAIETREQARENAAKFIQQLAIEINVLENNQTIDPRTVATAEQHPQFSALLQQSLLNASQTDDDEKHDLLARLVATRLSSDAETTVSLASQLAADAIARSTRRQLKLLALACFLEDVRPRRSLDVAEYSQWLDTFLIELTDFEFEKSDARHLVATGCIAFDPTSERDLQIRLQTKCGTHCIGNELQSDVVGFLQISWDLGLAGVSLTSVGSIVGGLALDKILRTRTNLPQWD